MRFLFNTVFYKPAGGGGGPIHSVSALAEELVRQGHQVTVACSNKDIPGVLDVDTEEVHSIAGVKVRYFRAHPTFLQRTGLPVFSRSGVFKFGPEFMRWLNSASGLCDVVHSHISFTWSNGPCSIFARNNRIPYLYHQRGNLDPVRLHNGYIKKKIFLSLIEKPIMKRADLLVALTQHEIETFRAQGLSNRIEVIPNGIDEQFGRLQSDVPISEGIRSLFSRLGNDVVFLWMSRLNPTKGPDIFVDSLIRLMKQHASIQGVIAGPDEQGLIVELQRRVREAGVANRFHYTGVVGGGDRVSLFRRANAIVLPTISEGMSMVLLEAMACACPVITTPGAHFPEIQESDAGVIVPCSVDGIADGMLQMYQKGKVEMARQGQNGQRLVQTRFSWTQIARRYASICEQLCKLKR